MVDEPVVLVVDDIADDFSRSPFGERWGYQVHKLSKEQLQNLQAGKLLAIDVQGEYVAYLKVEPEALSNKESTS